MMATSSPSPDRDALLGLIARACVKAGGAPSEGVEFVVGVCDVPDRLIHSHTLTGWRQVDVLSDNLKDLGFQAVIAGTASEMKGCDILFVPVDRAGPDLFDS
jgi:hypothetical protein